MNATTSNKPLHVHQVRAPLFLQPTLPHKMSAIDRTLASAAAQLMGCHPLVYWHLNNITGTASHFGFNTTFAVSTEF